jgi:hypothetical protein
MAGHRRRNDGTIRPTRREARTASFLASVQAAATAEEQCSTAFDFWRSVVYRHDDREELLNELATYLINEARRLDRRAAS